MEVGIVLGLVIAVVSGGASAHLATSKGHSGTGYFWLGFFLPLIGILVAGFMPPAEHRVGASRQSRPTAASQRTVASPSKSREKKARPSRQLAALRPIDDPAVATMLRLHGGALDACLNACSLGERVLAFGAGKWMNRDTVYVMTSGRFIFVLMAGGHPTTVAPLTSFEFDAGSGSFKRMSNVFTPTARSPFDAAELADLIRESDTTDNYLKKVGVGEFAPPGAPEPVADDTQPEEAKRPPADAISELERLNALRHDGAINDAEFAELKRRLVWGDGDSTESSG